ncbi:thiaminase II [Salisediminibacterium halotolerans]|uniref:thiaminase II n=1 Tax=Salisediminibacterium halotolerans TaxID=517425 RepID=UPI000EB071DD|nr:thiaminase II [Salisediminibacterium halotolerans]RLJ71689.1 thiaminase/transcriptional activator TenA [Actinophytocola xinjiangensis]RPE86839.1 thiaminase/transcriptional activator TenA [Salisediminibacterium halotolerans]TWG32902.1 thiaminase/transcriptional activator TenA [Salisediminibacterium halotolerans]GEL07756.1 aminopyrimidine aminohydrolase [Salisediminibacterium halotolerans]
MKFSEQLRKEADPIFEAIFKHPFIEGIARGDVPKEALIHYVKQDYEYLSTFCRIYGLAVSQCESREDMMFFQEQIAFVLNEEVHPHNNFCEVAGVNYDDLQHAPLAPTAHHYTRHMLEAASNGSLGETLAALAPCPWTYWEIGERLTKEVKPGADHPFAEWISFYANDEVAQITQTFKDKIDKCAEKASEKEREQMMAHFLKSTQLEHQFWTMAYEQETWPVETKHPTLAITSE